MGRGRHALALLALLAVPSGCASFEAARLYERGTHALDRGDTGEAIADLERASALWPRASEIQNHLGLAYAAAGRDEDALLAFRRAVRLDCSNAAAVHNLAAAEAHAERGPAPGERVGAALVERAP